MITGSGNHLVDIFDREQDMAARLKQEEDGDPVIVCGYCCQQAVSNPCPECAKSLEEIGNNGKPIFRCSEDDPMEDR
jgi:hypothetical protein